jgi:hypothetical protein
MRPAPLLLAVVCVVTAAPADAIPNRRDRSAPQLRPPLRSLAGARVVLRGDVQLRWEPGGRVVKKLARRDPHRGPRGTVTGVVVAEAIDDLRVRVDIGPLRGLFWIDRGDVITEGAAPTIAGTIPPPAPAARGTIRALEAGTCLHARPDGPVVAAVARASSFRDRPGPRGWRWVAVPLLDDDVEVAVRPGDPERCLTAAEIAAP